jgi:hypothetical protein
MEGVKKRGALDHPGEQKKEHAVMEQADDDIRANMRELIMPNLMRPYRASSPRPLYLTECLLIGPKENAA